MHGSNEGILTSCTVNRRSTLRSAALSSWTHSALDRAGDRVGVSGARSWPGCHVITVRASGAIEAGVHPSNRVVLARGAGCGFFSGITAVVAHGTCVAQALASLGGEEAARTWNGRMVGGWAVVAFGASRAAIRPLQRVLARPAGRFDRGSGALLASGTRQLLNEGRGLEGALPARGTHLVRTVGLADSSSCTCLTGGSACCGPFTGVAGHRKGISSWTRPTSLACLAS